jgi:hypothetical protein
VIRHLDVIRIRQAGTGGLRQPAKKFLYFLLTPAAPWFLGTEARRNGVLHTIRCFNIGNNFKSRQTQVLIEKNRQFALLQSAHF